MRASKNTSFALLESEDRGCAAPGMKPPKVHSELTSQGNDGLLALRPGSSGSFGQDGEPRLHRVISGLKTHHAPCQLNQNGPQPAISMFCDRTRRAFGPRAIFARTETRVTGDLTPVLEALPIADLAANDYAAQGAHARGQHGRSRLLQLDSESTNLLIEGEQGWPVEFKVGQYPGWQKLAPSRLQFCGFHQCAGAGNP
jgi:hypothetical protein